MTLPWEYLYGRSTRPAVGGPEQAPSSKAQISSPWDAAPGGLQAGPPSPASWTAPNSTSSIQNKTVTTANAIFLPYIVYSTPQMNLCLPTLSFNKNNKPGERMRQRRLFFCEEISPLKNKRKKYIKIIAEWICLNVPDCSPLNKVPREQCVPLMRPWLEESTVQ